MSRLEGAYEQVSERLTSIDLRLDGIDRRLEGVDRRIDGIDRKIDVLRETLDRKIDRQFMWMVGMFATTWLTTIGLYLRH
jgi:ActR/RegA family two-component response regulator